MSVMEYLYVILISDQNGSLTAELFKSVKLQTSVRNTIGFIAQFLLRYTSVLRLYIYILRWLFIPPEEERILDRVKYLSKRRSGWEHIYAYNFAIQLIKLRREEAWSLWTDGCAGLQGALSNYSGNSVDDMKELLRENQPNSVVVRVNASVSAVAPEDAVVGDKRAEPDDAAGSEDERPPKRGKEE